jgi:hypothetical protein
VSTGVCIADPGGVSVARRSRLQEDGGCPPVFAFTAGESVAAR